MVYRDILSQLKPRAERLGLTDLQTGRADDQELAQYMWSALMFFWENYDLDEFTVIQRFLFVTTSGIEGYRLPDTFGRLLTPWNREYGGITIAQSDGTGQTDLRYRPPAVFNASYDSSNTSQPTYFTFIGRDMLLSAIPNSAYRIGGTYIEAIAPQLDDMVPSMLHRPLMTHTLTQLASDIGRMTPLLLKEEQQAIAMLARNQGRRRIQFQRRVGSQRDFS